MQGWNGHRSTTSVVLLDLMTTAQTGRTAFSRSQRALFTACEFWAACRNNMLSQHLGEQPEIALRSAELSFELIRLPATASILRDARRALEEGRPAPKIEDIVAIIERQIESAAEDVDAGLAAFADAV